MLTDTVKTPNGTLSPAQEKSLDEMTKATKPKPVVTKRVCYIVPAEDGARVEIEPNADETDIVIKLVTGTTKHPTIPFIMNREQWELLCDLRYEIRLKDRPTTEPMKEDDYPF